MTEQINDLDPTIDVEFTPMEWIDRLRASSKKNPDGNGYLSLVQDRGQEGDRHRVPIVAFDSRAQHGQAGVFETHLQATAYAERWKDARVAQLGRQHDLRVRRGLGLSTRLQRLSRERAYLEEEGREIGRKKKENEAVVGRLIRDANDPVVEIDLRPTSDAWRLFDGPCETDGTLEMSRQLVLEHTGLAPITASVSEANAETQEEESVANVVEIEVEDEDEWPAIVVDSKGKSLRRGSWVNVDGWDVRGRVVGVRMDGLLEVHNPETGINEPVGNVDVTRCAKPRRKAPPKGLDPSAVVWPEDEGGVDL